MGAGTTKSYTEEHIRSVRRLLNKFADILRYKGEVHDKSKLEDPELYGWAAMDLEPRYEYGSADYYDKLNRFADVFHHHYMVNSHHPEHFKNPEQEMTLIDMIEMLCDWFAYKENVPLEEGLKLIEDQCDRFNFSKTIKSLLTNTYTEYIHVDYLGDIFEKQQKIIADKDFKNSLNYAIWENYFNKKHSNDNNNDIPDSGIDFSDICWW